MRLKQENHYVDIAEERELALVETSTEPFDRVAFAKHALDLVCPPRTTVAICEGMSRVRVEAGRRWGSVGSRWATLSIPPRASRRAIALAVAELAETPVPYALDVLLTAAAYR